MFQYNVAQKTEKKSLSVRNKCLSLDTKNMNISTENFKVGALLYRDSELRSTGRINSDVMTT